MDYLYRTLMQPEPMHPFDFWPFTDVESMVWITVAVGCIFLAYLFVAWQSELPLSDEPEEYESRTVVPFKGHHRRDLERARMEIGLRGHELVTGRRERSL